ncbi:Brix domain-containing protein [Radiomyces spectabilis]|uniref:Brix domain-containing protein n=1 Tax=Radiomyces spectabilis TaxID=64574 RepID=UPI00221F51EF|nr:Brix domain-containing protein [Radiomyces spectabilis]KAI8381117.1 Brix domain-containing protein [Radiomyces spectabilis]
MAKRKRKNRTHVAPTEEEMNKIPKSFVMRSGIVGQSVTKLVHDVRRIMEPNTASHLKERRTNRLKDFVSVAGQLGVTNFMIFSRTEKNVNLRICRVPRGPTLTFRVAEYALAKDCLALQRNPKSSDAEYHKSPLLVLNNFKQEGKEFKVMTAMLQNMFPAIEIQTMQLSQARRVLLFNYNEETKMIDVRHYSIGVKATGVSKSIKRVINTDVPDLGNFEDIADYVLKEAIISESDVEDGPESTVTLAQNFPGRNNRKNEQRAVKLHELGPRLTLELIKVENGLCSGEVLYHRYVKKTKQEIKEHEAKRQRTLREKAERKRQQEENVQRKQQEKEEHRIRTGGAPKKGSDDESDDNEDNQENTHEADEEEMEENELSFGDEDEEEGEEEESEDED